MRLKRKLEWSNCAIENGIKLKKIVIFYSFFFEKTLMDELIGPWVFRPLDFHELLKTKITTNLDFSFSVPIYGKLNSI